MSRSDFSCAKRLGMQNAGGVGTLGLFYFQIISLCAKISPALLLKRVCKSIDQMGVRGPGALSVNLISVSRTYNYDCNVHFYGLTGRKMFVCFKNGYLTRVLKVILQIYITICKCMLSSRLPKCFLN